MSDIQLVNRDQFLRALRSGEIGRGLHREMLTQLNLPPDAFQAPGPQKPRIT